MPSIKGLGVDCPKCHNATKVVDTYWSTDLNAKARRRRCLVCDGSFTTTEQIVPDTFKSSVHRQPGRPRKVT